MSLATAINDNNLKTSACTFDGNFEEWNVGSNLTLCLKILMYGTIVQSWYHLNKIGQKLPINLNQ
jgi:hypothetical protein